MPFINKSPLNYLPNTSSSIRVFEDSKPPTANDFKNFKVSDQWWDNAGDDFYLLVKKDKTSGIWRKMAGTAAAVETFEGNAGGKVGPDATNNIQLLGSGDITITGNPATNTLTVAADVDPISKYIVDSNGETPYTTIQAAITAANTAAVPATVYLRPGTYTEDLTLFDGIDINGGISETSIIIGSHTPPASGTLNLYNINLNSATDIITSAAAGTTNISFDNCKFSVTNGYILNVANWTGALSIENSSTDSTTDGIINTTSSSNVQIINSFLGGGSANVCTLTGSGTVELHSSEIRCPITIGGSRTAELTNGINLENTLTTAGTATVEIANSSFNTGANTAISHGSANPLTLDVIGINTTVEPVIDGAGAGVINLGSTSFLNCFDIADTLTLNRTKILDTALTIMNGSIVESPVVTVASDGAIITLTLEKSGTGDLTLVFSSGYHFFDSSPAATIALTAGTDTAPQLNYVYIPESTNVLTLSTVGWPAAEHVPIAEVLCESAATLATKKAYKVHSWTDHFTGSDNQGHIAHINHWIRDQNATYENGVLQTYTITPNGGAPDNVTLNTASGEVLQLHEHDFPAFGAGHDYYVINDSVTPYTIVTDLNALLTDSAGGSLSNRFFSLVVWGVVSEATADCKIYVNLPGGSYSSASTLTADANKFANFTIPGEFVGTGFLISQWNLRHQVAGGGTWTSVDEIDLRGFFPGVSAGSGSAAATQFPDNTFRVFDQTDATKLMAFEVSGVTTATTRTYTVPNASGDMGLVTALAANGMAYASDANTVTSTAAATDGQLLIGDTGSIPLLSTLTAGTGVSIANAAGSITISSTGGGMTWTEVTGTSQALAVNNGYIANNAGLVTLTLPATAAVGDAIRIVGKGAGGWKLAQNAGQTVHFSSQNSTTGAGGSFDSTHQRDCIKILCTTANTDFTIISSIGNIDPT